MSSQKHFAAFDIDGTLFRSGLYREVVHELIRMEVLPKSVLSAFAAKEKAWQKRSHGDAFWEFEEAMAVAFEKTLPRLKVEDFDRAAERVIEAHKDNTYVYTRKLAEQLKGEGRTLVAISGSQLELVEPFAKHYGFDIWVGQHYVRDGDSFTGEVIKTHQGKGKFLRQVIDEHDLSLEDSIAVGDTKGDTEMLQMVDNPIAFNPEKILFELALDNKWKVVLERKNMIYELEANGDGEYVIRNTDTH